MRIRTDAEESTEGHTQALMEVMVDSATSFDPLCVALQEVQDQRPDMTRNQQSVILLQEELSQTLQNAQSVLLAPDLQRESGLGWMLKPGSWLNEAKGSASHIVQRTNCLVLC